MKESKWKKAKVKAKKFVLTLRCSRTAKYSITLSPKKKKFDVKRKYQLRVRNQGKS